MNDKRKWFWLLGSAVLVTLAVVAACPDEVWARAGGGRSHGAGLLGFILFPILLAYSMVITNLVLKKNRQCQELLAQATSKDAVWDPDALEARVERAFYRIQHAWQERDQDLAKDYMSERLYNKHKARTDAMIANKRINVLESLDLLEARIVQIVDYKNNTKDYFWVYIKAAAIDYEIDEENGKVVDGENDKIYQFAELWKFIRTDKGWVADEIDRDVSIGDLVKLKSFIES